MSINNFLQIGFSCIGLIFGAFFAIVFCKLKNKNLAYVESFASGFMLAVIFFDLLPHSLSLTKLHIVILGILTGIFLILLVEAICNNKKCAKSIKCAIIYKKGILNKKATIPTKVEFARFATLFAVALHNLPEGIALGALANEQVAIATAILIALHNLPEGIAMSVPLLKANVKKSVVVLVAIFTSFLTFLGWLIGYYVSGLNNDIIAFTLAIASGCMMQIVFVQEMIEIKDKKVALMLVFGLILGLCIAKMI